MGRGRVLAYAQTTSQNLRILSLLSSVLQREIRSDFVPAIEATLPLENECGRLLMTETRTGSRHLVFVTHDQSTNNSFQVLQKRLKDSMVSTETIEMRLNGVIKGSPFRDIPHLADSKIPIVVLDGCLLSGSCSFVEDGESKFRACGVVVIYPRGSRCRSVLIGQCWSQIHIHLDEPSDYGSYGLQPNAITLAIKGDPDEKALQLWLLRCVVKFVQVATILQVNDIRNGLREERETGLPSKL